MYFTYTGVRVTDLKRSLNFYKKVMGMKIILRGKMHHGGVFVHLKSPKSSQRLELNWYPKQNKYYKEYLQGEELDHLAFWCNNVHEEFASLVGKGASPTIQPFREGRYELAFLMDPDGIWIELLGKSKPSKMKERKTK
jgi:lactoylglutathione lyase